MRVVGYVRNSADQTEQRRRLEGGAAFRDDELVEVLVDDPGRLRELVAAGEVAAVLVSRLDRLPAGWLDDDELMELFERQGVAIVAGRERIDTSMPAGRLALAEWRTDRARAVIDAWAKARQALDPRPPG